MPSFVSIVETSKLKNQHGCKNIEFLRQLDKLALKTNHNYLKNVRVVWEITIDFDEFVEQKGTIDTIFSNIYVSYKDNEYKIEFKYNSLKDHMCYEIGIYSENAHNKFNNKADKYFRVGRENFEKDNYLLPYNSNVNGGDSTKKEAREKVTTSKEECFFIGNELNETAFQILFEYARSLQDVRN